MDSENLELYRQELTEEPQYTKILDSAFEIIKKLRIPVNGYDGEAPPMPDDITNISDAELGEHLNKQTQWAGYVAQKLAEFESYYTVILNELEFTQANIHTDYLRDPDIKGTKITERKEFLKTDKRFVSLNREKLRYEVICNILKANLNASNNNWVNLSRQITLKGQDQQREFRSHNALSYVPKGNLPQSPGPKAFTNVEHGTLPNTPTPRRSKK